MTATPLVGAMRLLIARPHPVIAGRKDTEEDHGEHPHTTAPSGGEHMKTLAIRLEDELHASLSIMAQLTGSTIADEIRRAIERHLHGMAQNPELSARASTVLEQIERDAQAKLQAINALFGETEGEGNTAPKSTGRRGGRTDATS